MKPVIIIVIAFVLLSSSTIPSSASYDCARNFDLLTELQNTRNPYSDDYEQVNEQLQQISLVWIENRCGMSMSSWASESLFPDRVRSADWAKFSHENKLLLGEIEPTTQEEKSLVEVYQNLKQETKKESEPITNSDIVCGKGTVDVNGQCVPDTKSSKGGGCLIATATYGSELAPEVQKLRELRDNHLLSTGSGASFMEIFNDVYYSFSPSIADYERENPLFKETVKIVITPMITSLSILNYVDMNSESEVLGYGISLILLNVVMYIGIPILAVMRFRK
jgi:hypothetical protein